MAIKNDKPQTEEERQATEMAVKDTPATDDQAPAAEADAAVAADADAAVESDDKQEEKVESPRDRVARRFAEHRREEMGETSGTVYDQAAEEEPEQREEAPAAATEDKPDTKQPPASEADEDDPVVKLKVHGREIELPLSEVRKQAQINIATSAGERALSDLNRQIQDRRAELDRLSKPAPQDTATNGDGRQAPKPTDKAPAEPIQLDQARLAELAEDFRNGTEEEATKAFSSLVSEIVNAVKASAPTEQPDIAEVVARTVDARLLGNQERTTINEALEKFAEDFPVIASHPDLEPAAYTRAVAGMLDDMKQAGVSERRLAELRNTNVTEVVDAHRKLRNFVDKDTGARPFAQHMRSYGDILTEVGNGLMTELRSLSASLSATPGQQPKPRGNGNGLAARTDLKRALPTQPRTTGARTQPEAQTPAGGRPNPKEAVQKIAALRRGTRSVA